MKKTSLLLFSLLGISMASQAATFVVVNNNAAKQGQYFRAVAIGAPRNTPVVGDLSDGWGVRQVNAGLPGDREGKYRIREVRFCVDTYGNCVDESTDSPLLRQCNLVDYTSGTVNQVNAKVTVNIYSSTNCTATVTR